MIRRMGLSFKRFVAGAGLSLLLSGSFHLAAMQAPQIADNPERPEYSGKEAPELVFKSELSIPLAGRRYSFDVDDSGNIYLLESLAGKIFVYDKNGHWLVQFGHKGQGPGEFENSAYLAVSKDHRVHVIDRPRKSIVIFNAQGKWLERKRLPSLGMMNNLGIDSRGFVHIQDMRNIFALKDEERIRRGVSGLSRLLKIDKAFEKNEDIEVWDNRFMKRSPGEGYDYVLYHDIFYYQIAADDSLYCGNSASYEIRRRTPDGRLSQIIRKKASRIPTTKRDRDRMMRDFPELKNQNPEISKTKPFFFDFHVLDQIGLLVGTYEDEWNDQATLSCDLFDFNGRFLAKVKVPRYYYAKDQDAISEQRNRIFRNGRCYSIVYDEDDDALKLVRHSIELKWPMERTNK